MLKISQICFGQKLSHPDSRELHHIHKGLYESRSVRFVLLLVHINICGVRVSVGQRVLTGVGCVCGRT